MVSRLLGSGRLDLDRRQEDGKLAEELCCEHEGADKFQKPIILKMIEVTPLPSPPCPLSLTPPPASSPLSFPLLRLDPAP
jgi:hypothetical protein